MGADAPGAAATAGVKGMAGAVGPGVTEGVAGVGTAAQAAAVRMTRSGSAKGVH